MDGTRLNPAGWERIGPSPQPSQRIPAPQQPAGHGQSETRVGRDFRSVLQEAVRQGSPAAIPLRFSGHAQARLQTAGIRLSDAALARLSSAVERAAAKGARESLILMDDVAFVVSVKNRTVITAVERERAKDNVFTNIDSAVIT